MAIRLVLYQRLAAAFNQSHLPIYFYRLALIITFHATYYFHSFKYATAYTMIELYPYEKPSYILHCLPTILGWRLMAVGMTRYHASSSSLLQNRRFSVPKISLILLPPYKMVKLGEHLSVFATFFCDSQTVGDIRYTWSSGLID